MINHTAISPTDPVPPQPSQASQSAPVSSSASDGLPSPTTSHSDESAPGVGEIANLSDAPSSDWTGSDEESEQEDHDFDMVASIDLSEAGSLGHRSTASSSGSGPGVNKMKLSYPNPMTTNEEVELDSMDEYHPDSAYSFLHDASSPVESAAVDACSVITDDTNSTSDKASGSVMDVRKAETSKWVESAAGTSPKRERRRSTVTAHPPNEDSAISPAPAELFPTVTDSVVVPGAFSISQHTEPDSAASSFASIRSSDSSATIVTPQATQAKPLYSEVVAEGLPDEPLASDGNPLVEVPIEEKEPAQSEKLPIKVEEPAKPSRGPSHLMTRSLIVLATVLAISAVKLIESVPSFADMKSHSHSTALSTSLAVSPVLSSSAFSSPAADPTATGSSSHPAQPALAEQRSPPAALAPVVDRTAIAVIPSEDDKSVLSDVDEDDLIETLAMEAAQEREGFEVDGFEDSFEQDFDDGDEAAAEYDANAVEDDEEYDYFDALLRGVGAPDLVEHVNGLVNSVDGTLSPYLDSIGEAWRHSLGHIPSRLSQVKQAHQHLRRRGRKAIGRRVRVVEQQGAHFAAVWLDRPRRELEVAWSQTTDAAKSGFHDAEHAWDGSKQFAGQAWAQAAEGEPKWTKREADEEWSVLGGGPTWKGLARRAVQGERVVRNPAKLGELLGKSFKRAGEIKHEVDAFRRTETVKHKKAMADTVKHWRRSLVKGKGPAAVEEA